MKSTMNMPGQLFHSICGADDGTAHFIGRADQFLEGDTAIENVRHGPNHRRLITGNALTPN